MGQTLVGADRVGPSRAGPLRTLPHVTPATPRSRRARPAEAGERAPSDFEGVRLHVVTGKGGTGKTTVAAALALALADQGKRTLLCEVEDRQGIAQLFDVPPLPYGERSVAVGPWGGQVDALAVEPQAALMEYLELFYKLGRAGRLLDKTGAIDFATTIAPGLRDVLLTGKVYEAVGRTQRPKGRGTRPVPVYDSVVLDAPPTGRISRFLNVNTEVSGLARVGPIHNQAASIMRMMQSTATVVHVVTLLEEMPVQETLDAVEELTAARLRVGGIIVNQVRNGVLTARALTLAGKGKLDADAVGAGLVEAGLVKPGDTSTPRAKAMVSGLLSEAAAHSRRLALQRRERAELDTAGPGVYELAYLPGGVDLGGLYSVAGQMRDQGLA